MSGYRKRLLCDVRSTSVWALSHHAPDYMAGDPGICLHFCWALLSKRLKAVEEWFQNRPYMLSKNSIMGVNCNDGLSKPRHLGLGVLHANL